MAHGLCDWCHATHLYLMKQYFHYLWSYSVRNLSSTFIGHEHSKILISYAQLVSTSLRCAHKKMNLHDLQFLQTRSRIYESFMVLMYIVHYPYNPSKYNLNLFVYIYVAKRIMDVKKVYFHSVYYYCTLNTIIFAQTTGRQYTITSKYVFWTIFIQNKFRKIRTAYLSIFLHKNVPNIMNIMKSYRTRISCDAFGCLYIFLISTPGGMKIVIIA